MYILNHFLNIQTLGYENDSKISLFYEGFVEANSILLLSPQTQYMSNQEIDRVQRIIKIILSNSSISKHEIREVGKVRFNGKQAKPKFQRILDFEEIEFERLIQCSKELNHKIIAAAKHLDEILNEELKNRVEVLTKNDAGKMILLIETKMNFTKEESVKKLSSMYDFNGAKANDEYRKYKKHKDFEGLIENDEDKLFLYKMVFNNLKLEACLSYINKLL